MCFQPVLSPTAISSQGYLHSVSLFHFLDDDLLYLLSFFRIDAEVQFIVYLEYHFRTDSFIQEALVETIGCSGMTHSAAMAAEILPGKTPLEALNTDLVCDAINTAMRELFLQIVYGRSQSAFSDDGLVIGAGLEDLGKGHRSQVGTMYSTLQKGVRYLEMAEGYVTRLALDANNEVIGYEFVSLGKMTDFIKKGMEPNEAYAKAMGHYGRFTAEQGAVKFIDPRKE